MKVLEKEERKKGTERLFLKIMAIKFPNLERDMVIHIHKAHRSQNIVNPKRSSQKHYVIKLSRIKDKERILKAGGKNLITYIGITTKLSVSFQQKSCRPGESKMIY